MQWRRQKNSPENLINSKHLKVNNMQSIFSQGELSVEVFLNQYWQKKPLLIRQAFPGFVCPIDANELAGLACEEHVESRIVLENDQGRPWQCRMGPFDESDFASLPPTHWTLLIQGLNNWVPDISDLLNYFRFIPNWHLDDIMASYAPDQGSVGPHFDFYDVFLLQAEGKRRWKIGNTCTADRARLEGTDLRILKEFETQTEWLLEPGDMLYLPPQIAHYGVAEGECITLSIGFRTPSDTELLSSLADYVCDHPPLEQHMPANHVPQEDNPGELTQASLMAARQSILNLLEDESRLANWFGTYATQLKHEDNNPLDEVLDYSEEELEEAIAEAEFIRWNEGSRFVYYQLADCISLYVDGNLFALPHSAKDWVARICAKSQIASSELLPCLEDSTVRKTMVALLNNQHIYLSDE
jgi:50S ribosomal protein L16 3-hydroxylase